VKKIKRGKSPPRYSPLRGLPLPPLRGTPPQRPRRHPTACELRHRRNRTAASRYRGLSPLLGAGGGVDYRVIRSFRAKGSRLWNCPPSHPACPCAMAHWTAAKQLRCFVPKTPRFYSRIKVSADYLICEISVIADLRSEWTNSIMRLKRRK
jgi:hypothetical protein